MLISLAQDINLVQGPKKARYPYCNCLYIDGGEAKVLIDTGCGKNDIGHLLEQRIDVVINSHFHEDHILNNSYFASSEVWAHRLDAPAISSMEVFKSFYGFVEEEERKWADKFIESMGLKAVPVTRELEDGDVLDFGRVKLDVVFTPGHTPGHCCFFIEKEGMLFAADIDLSQFGPWYGHACSDLDDLLRSVNKCIEIGPKIVITGHGSGIVKDDIPHRMRAFAEVVLRKEELVLSFLKERPHTLDELAEKKIFYSSEPIDDPFYALSERMAIEQHLRRLMKNGEIAKEGATYYCK